MIIFVVLELNFSHGLYNFLPELERSVDNLLLMDSSSEVDNVSRYLASKDIWISKNNEWLKSCVGWFKTENAGCDIGQIQEFAYNQLLLADLCVVGQGCLPPTVSEARSTKLLGKYFLQINYVLDVGNSVYSQFQNLRKKSFINLEVTEEKQEAWEPRANRMLKMEITDGVSVVYGMEFSPIRKLSVNIVPGAKILIKGPVECRSGVIMLQEKHVVVLGGEVDSLYESNHYNRLITRTLNLDANILPVDDEALQTLPSNALQCNTVNPVPSSRSLRICNADSSVNSSTLRKENRETVNEQHVQRMDNDDYFADSEIFLNVPVDIVTDDESRCTKRKLIEVHGNVAAFRSKLIIKNNKWFVSVRINSEEGTIKASFDPDLLDRLIGFSPSEMNSRESEMAVNPAIKEKMNAMLKRGQQVIKDLKCDFSLVQEGDDLPVIIAISDESAYCDPSK